MIHYHFCYTSYSSINKQQISFNYCSVCYAKYTDGTSKTRSTDEIYISTSNNIEVSCIEKKLDRELMIQDILE